MLKIKKQIKLSDIAKKLNVSTVTISKALRNHSDIPEEHAIQIKEVADKLGYIPNFAARNLSAKKTNTIGVIIPVIANHFFATMIELIYEYAFENNYDIILAVSQEDTKKEKKHLETMLSMQVDGIIISVVEHSENEKVFAKIKDIGIPIVFFDRTIDDEKYCSVTLKNKEGALIAVEKAIEQGYENIGHIGGWQDSNIGKDRHLGFKQAMKNHNLTINKSSITFSGFGKKDGYNSFMNMYNEDCLPDLLFATTFPIALGIIEAAKDVGVKIPYELDIICFGDSDINEYLNPSLSCITHNTNNYAKKVVKLVFELINSNGKGKVKHLQVETELVMRNTCMKI
ncbi:MAG: LacI family DNA-binding transcriptional regulator [Melioribacteraceae bacterium]